MAFMVTRWHISTKYIVELGANPIFPLRFIRNFIDKCHLVAINTSLPSHFLYQKGLLEGLIRTGQKTFLLQKWTGHKILGGSD